MREQIRLMVVGVLCVLMASACAGTMDDMRKLVESPPSPPSSCSFPPMDKPIAVITTAQNRAMEAKSGGVVNDATDDAAAEIVTAEFLKRGYRVVDRAALNALLRESAFQRSGLVDKKTVSRIRKKLGAGAIVIANVYNTGEEHHPSTIQTQTGSPIWDVAKNLIDPSGIVRTVEMTVKMIDVETAEILCLQDRTQKSRAASSTSHTDLLRLAVASLSFKGIESHDSDPILTGNPTGGGRCRTTTYDPKIEDAQGVLKKRGYYKGQVDGCPGPKTLAAIRQFQRVNDLSPTGDIDPPTEAALREPKKQAVTTPAPAPPEEPAEDNESDASSPPEPPTADRVPIVVQPPPDPPPPLVAVTVVERPVQGRLKELGYYQGKIDGRMRPSVRAALRKFQKDVSLPQTGEADGATKKALGLE